MILASEREHVAVVPTSKCSTDKREYEQEEEEENDEDEDEEDGGGPVQSS